jgi:hypothetical protein
MFIFPGALILAELRNTRDYTANTILLTTQFQIWLYILHYNHLKWKSC